jgi:hypothetical protein
MLSHGLILARLGLGLGLGLGLDLGLGLGLRLKMGRGIFRAKAIDKEQRRDHLEC